MVIMAVDDEKLMLAGLVDCIRQAAPEAAVYAFRRSSEALEFACSHSIDVAFLDIHMREMDGLTLGRALLNLYPRMNLIFCTSFSEYIEEAFLDVRCNGYVKKPVDVDAIRRELQHLRVPLEKNTKRVKLRCFGKFEVFVDGSPIAFENSRTREMLAYLVDACGAVCSNQEIIDALWADFENHDSYFKKLRKDLMDTFDRLGCPDVIFRQRAGLGINTDLVDCDYYTWKTTHEGEDRGEYMSQYIWAGIPK